MHDIDNLPVLILAYNRYDKFTKCISTLHKFGARKFFVSVDGPKNNCDLEEQKKICFFCKNNNLEIDPKINILKTNNGCRWGPIKGISWFFNENKYGVILEDDVIVSKACLETFCILLQKYIYSREIMSLSSFNEYEKKETESIYSMPIWRSWGWASWSDKWIEHINFSKEINKYSFWKLYNLLSPEIRSIETIKLLKASHFNFLDAWDYEFNFTHLAKNYKSLTIGGINNFVYGFDNSATHTIDLESIDIDFNLFNKNKIDISNIIEYDFQKSIRIMEKSGFFYKADRNFFIILIDFFRSIFYTLIFFLRKFKRIIFKLL